MSGIFDNRPRFLAVLCVLSMLNSAVGLLGFLMSLAFSGYSSVSSEQFEQIKQMADDLNGHPLLQRLLWDITELSSVAQHPTGFPNNVVTILLLISGIGAYLMFRLNKSGFYIYTGAQVLMPIIPLFVFFANLLMIFSCVFNLVFAGVFIIMYAINLKHMR